MPRSGFMPGLPTPITDRSATEVFDRLAKRRLVVVSGKGGVGRTTLAALMALAIAQRGRRVLVATTGHDDRLAWILGAKQLSDQPQVVAPKLWIQRLVPQTCLREYGGLVMRSQRASSAVFDNRLVRKLLRAIPGLDDFAVVGKAWHEAIRGGSYDCVIFDGPATGHLLFTLEVPRSILDTLPRGPLTREAQLIQSSFEDASSIEAVLVGLPESWPLTELAEFGVALRKRVRMNVAAIAVNGVWPLPELPEDAPAMASHPVLGSMVTELTRIRRIGAFHRDNIESWRSSPEARACQAGGLMMLPWRWGGIVDLEGARRQLATLDEFVAKAPRAGVLQESL